MWPLQSSGGSMCPSWIRPLRSPARKELGPQMIPVHRLVGLQFEIGGIRQVDETKPKAD